MHYVLFYDIMQLMSDKNIQNWTLERYSTLLGEFKEESFTFNEAFDVLNKKHEDSKAQVRNILSDLNEAEMIKSKKSPNDKRKKVYKLVSLSPEETQEKELTRKELNRLVDRAADIIRTRVDYTFILLLLFYKRISDKWELDYRRELKKLKEEGFSEKEAKQEASEPEYHDLDLPQEYLWRELRKEPLHLSTNLSEAMKELADRNEGLRDIFTQFDFVQFTNSKENNEILRQLFELLSSYSLENTSPDILGDAYERILKKFAPEKAKEGEVYTPREVVELMVRILDPEPEETIYDPALGSGGMLIKVYEYVKEKYGKDKADTLFLYGQEHSFQTLGLAKMNLLIHNIKNGIFEQGDTLRFPKFKEKGKLKQFDKGIFNPPWNQSGYGEEELKKAEHTDRFKFGFVYKNKADWAWVQHMYSSIKDDGKFTVVLDTGAVSRGSGGNSNKEKVVRKKFVEKDLIESVILLPEKIFYNTNAPGIVMVVNKDKPKERKNKVLFINASDEYEEGSPQNTIIEENIEKIVETYKNFNEVEGFSDIISKDEIEESDYNLSPSRFVFVIDEEKHRDIDEIWSDIEEIENKEKETDKKVANIIKKLN